MIPDIAELICFFTNIPNKSNDREYAYIYIYVCVAMICIWNDLDLKPCIIINNIKKYILVFKLWETFRDVSEIEYLYIRNIRNLHIFICMRHSPTKIGMIF